jgi:hypothetical protein
MNLIRHCRGETSPDAQISGYFRDHFALKSCVGCEEGK